MKLEISLILPKFGEHLEYFVVVFDGEIGAVLVDHIQEIDSASVGVVLQNLTR